MSRLTLRLPESLHQQLLNLASIEGVSLNQYIVYALTRQISSHYTVQPTSEENREQQAESFRTLLEQLGEASPTEIKAILAQREKVEPEPDLKPEVMDKIRQLIREKEQLEKKS